MPIGAVHAVAREQCTHRERCRQKTQPCNHVQQHADGNRTFHSPLNLYFLLIYHFLPLYIPHRHRGNNVKYGGTHSGLHFISCHIILPYSADHFYMFLYCIRVVHTLPALHCVLYRRLHPNKKPFFALDPSLIGTYMSTFGWHILATIFYLPKLRV